MAEQDFKSLDEQLSILKSRGLKIADTDKAKHFLYRNNYYRRPEDFQNLKEEISFRKSEILWISR